MNELTDAEVMKPKQRELSDAEVMAPVRDTTPTPGLTAEIDRASMMLPKPFLDRFDEGDAARKREGGLLQAFPQFVDMMSAPEGRTKLWEAAKSYPLEFIKGMIDTAKVPGAVAKGELDLGTEEGMDAAIGLGSLVGLGRLNKLPLTGKTAGVALESGEQMARIIRGPDGQIHEQPVGGLPRAEDFTTGAEILGSDATEANLRRLWEEDGIHPSEAVHDAQTDAWVKHQITTSIEAYHGSPHEFEAFDISKIGTGEGAQSYGHGLYFAQNEAVAQTYQKPGVATVGGPEFLAADTLTEHGGNRAAAIADLEQRKQSLLTAAPAEHDFPRLKPEQISGAVDLLKSDWTPQTNLYKVRINADPATFLDWDKPLSEQAPKVRSALMSAFDALRTEFPILRDKFEFDKPSTGSITGRDAVKELEDVAGRERASAVLRDAGIPGIKYLDQGSRNLADLKGEIAHVEELGGPKTEAEIGRMKWLQEQVAKAGDNGTSNFVVFDDKLVQITHKNGVPFYDKIFNDAQNAQIGRIISGQEEGEIPFRSVGAEATSDPPIVPLSEQPTPPAGRLMSAAKDGIAKLYDIGRDLQMLTTPMAAGTRDSMSIAKDAANAWRRNRWEWSRIDDDIKKRFSLEQQERMFNAMDEESVVRQELKKSVPVEQLPGPERIVGAAIIADGRVFIGGNHILAIDEARKVGADYMHVYEGREGREVDGGFFTSKGRYVTRQEAADIANVHGKFETEEIYRNAKEKGVLAEGILPRKPTTGADNEFIQKWQGKNATVSEHMGLATLEPAERAAVVEMDTRQQLAWLQARDLNMVEGDGIPMHAPRMVINIANATDKDRALSLDAIGRNLFVRTSEMRHRKYQSVEETEAAAKIKFGEEAVVARNIRALALSTAKLEDAIVGRQLVNDIKEAGKRTGEDTISEGARPIDSEHKWFTLDHPALRTWRPKFEEVDGKITAALDANGNPIFEQVPIYIRGDFEGPLRAILNHNSGALYGAAMSLKGKTMSLIMNSPLIHNAVEWGRALPAMPGKVATFKVYFEGNRAKHDLAQMREAIDSGLVPIGKRFFNQDIEAIMEEPNLSPGRSWTAQIARFIPDLFDPARPGTIVGGPGDKVAAAIDKAGDFWHNTLLWDRVADLQMGLYTNFRDDMLAKGVDRQTATIAAAHWANRYAGALPKEAMSDGARKMANLLLFSRSFTLGNIGAMKDMLTGLPKDVIAQLERNAGFREGAINEAGELAGPAAEAVSYAKTMARRKAMAIVALDVGLMYVGNSLLQNVMNTMLGDSTLDKEMHAYAERFLEMLSRVKEHPLSLLQPFGLMESMSATHENEPSKSDRIKVGTAADGTAIYARNPAGKIGEEFTGWITGPLDMLRRKLGTIARPAWQIMSNDAGFGRKVYDPTADTPEKYLKNIGLVVAHLVKSQFPEGQLSGAADLVKGEGDPKVNALQAFGPIAGVTFSKGAPGGPAVGELYHARTMHNYAVDAQLPDIRKQIQRGEVLEARERMTELGIPAGLQNFYVRTSQNPSLRLTPRALRDFYQYSTPEQRERLLRAR